jgi:hypothetical protein
MTCRYVLPQYLNLNREAFGSAAELAPRTERARGADTDACCRVKKIVLNTGNF